MKKQNFILIPSFSTNSVILKGLISRLSDYFKVYPIDYPGYRSNKSTLDSYSIQSITDKLENDIEKLYLNSYIVGGVSMGYLFANHIGNKDKQCKGKVAMFPLVSDKCININPLRRLVFKLGLKIIKQLSIYELIWNSSMFKSKFLNEMFPKDIYKIIKNDIDHKSFFEMANLIIGSKYEIRIDKTPHVLVINESDYAIKSALTIDIFSRNIPNKIVIKSKMPHNPNSLEKKVFNEYLDDPKMKRIVNYFDNYM